MQFRLEGTVLLLAPFILLFKRILLLLLNLDLPLVIEDGAGAVAGHDLADNVDLGSEARALRRLNGRFGAHVGGRLVLRELARELVDRGLVAMLVLPQHGFGELLLVQLRAILALQEPSEADLLLGRELLRAPRLLQILDVRALANNRRVLNGLVQALMGRALILV